MNRSRELHEQAINVLDQGWSAQRAGLRDEAATLFMKAYALEKEAAELISASTAHEPSRSILFKSAAEIAVKCGMLHEAARLAHAGLAGYSKGKSYRALEALLDEITFKRHLQVEGVDLSTDDVQVSLSGKGIGPGVAPMQQVVGRLNSTKLLLFRSTERQLRRPYRDAGKPTDRVREIAQAFISAPRAASFAVSISVGNTDQASLPGIGNSEAVVDDLLDCLEMFESGDESALRFRISDAAYFNNFVALARSLAPDGTVIDTVGFTAKRGKGQREVAMRRTLTELAESFLPLEGLKTLDESTVTIEGRVLFADSTAKMQTIKLVGESGVSTVVIVPEGLMSDIVRPLWNEWAKAKAKYRGKKLHLMDIHPL